MNKKIIEKTPFQLAFDRWFSDYEAQRKKRGKRRGTRLSDFPPPPIHPEEVRNVVDTIGRGRVLSVLEIHRTTLARWMTGESVIPRPAWLLLVLMAEGRLPGMSADWSGIRFDGDRLHILGTRQSYTALEIAGWHYQQQHAQALARRIEHLEGKLSRLLSIADFGAANDAVISL